ncbi:enoyl-CoA hydratase/isomerase family protein [Variovorax ginsengisoli]|uniref:Enoyl-CoA hydratase/isomerase family protein n=1 Tax=Variovorax ginsengisoli TaxID=363844 RepID=A0ABT8SFE9_9BURK|nr:enoyl-CoA hydratase/isomerase family protein [Variovorax ginsengisoli]MDN8618345.1 enoyl-CoA hydratase/isomerase family protein [Variovorax ginsengisoli]MDO1537515.1 enoyl-CoA hydratase/isomerase family protein [Variovorax ginsengisoli]
MNAPFRYEITDQVATLTLDHPATRNALGPEVRDALADAIRDIQRRSEVRAVVLTGASGHFCSGGDLRNIAGAGLDNQGWHGRMHGVHEWLRALIMLDRPVISAVDGAAFGAGFGLALAADYVIGTPRTRMCVSFLRVGLVPDFGLFYTLPRIVGPQRAKELMLSAREVGADEALRLGLLAELQPPDQLQARARAVAASFVNASPMAVSLVKRAVACGGDLTTQLELEANAQSLAMGSTGHRDAVQDFLAKRPARFQWPA